MAIYFLKCYSTESQLAAVFKISERTVRKWCWFYICRIQALKGEKVSKSVSLLAMPSEVSDDFLQIVRPTYWNPGHIDFVNEDIPVFLLTVDGMHWFMNLAMHPIHSQQKHGDVFIDKINVSWSPMSWPHNLQKIIRNF